MNHGEKKYQCQCDYDCSGGYQCGRDAQVWYRTGRVTFYSRCYDHDSSFVLKVLEKYFNWNEVQVSDVMQS